MTNKRVFILGKHPLADNLIQQYERMGYGIEHRRVFENEDVSINDYDELCLLPEEGEESCALALLPDLGAGYDMEAHGDKKLICHLLLSSNQTLQMLQVCDFCDTVRRKMDVYPFSKEEVWSRSIVLDYKPITLQSEEHVHLIIFGMGEISEMVVIQAAHVAHYPNYVRNHSLRTRITMIDVKADRKYQTFIKKYQHLFDNSYYRVVKPSEDKAIVKFHKPMYEGKREDFVDVEWEFVAAESWNADLREKLQFWAKDKKQLLTVVMADKDSNKNKSEALLLPQELYQQSIPIYIYGQQMDGYDVTLPWVRMAKNVKYVYDCCYYDNVKDWNGLLRFAVEIDPLKRELLWAEESNVKRMSNIYNAMTIPTKMRSLGLKEDDWDKFYDLSQKDIELLAQVEHNRWNVEELILGYRPCTDAEQDIIAADVATQKDAYKTRKIHYDLRAYNDLRPDKTGRGVQVYDLCLSACLPLIAKAFTDEKGGEE